MSRSQPGGIEPTTFTTEDRSTWLDSIWVDRRNRFTAALGVAVFSLSACSSEAPTDRPAISQGTGDRGEIPGSDNVEPSDDNKPNKKEPKTQAERDQNWQEIGLDEATFFDKTDTFGLEPSGMAAAKRQTIEQLVDMMESSGMKNGGFNGVTTDDKGYRTFEVNVFDTGERDAIVFDTTYTPPMDDIKTGGSIIEINQLTYWFEPGENGERLTDVQSALSDPKELQKRLFSTRWGTGHQREHVVNKANLQAWYGTEDVGPNKLQVKAVNPTDNTFKDISSTEGRVLIRNITGNVDQHKRFWENGGNSTRDPSLS